MRVLLPIGDSERGQRAADLAFDLFAGETVVLLHVINPAEAGFSTESTMPDFPEGWYEEEKERIHDLFDDLEAQATTHDVTVEQLIELGKPSDVIVDTVEEEDIDHIVMGSHGRKGVSRILLGSVSETVIRRASVPATVVR